MREQARCLEIPLIEIDLPENCPNHEYERRLVEGLAPHTNRFRYIAFGDLFLDGIKEYRESFLGPAGFELIFPLLGNPTRALAKAMISSGLRAKVCSVDSTQLDPKFAGRNFDSAFLAALPGKVDPCGEKGEFHTFVYDGPFFRKSPQVIFGPAEGFDRFTFLEIRSSKNTGKHPFI